MKAYIYVTKAKPYLRSIENYGWQHKKPYTFELTSNKNFWDIINGLIPARFDLNEIDKITNHGSSFRIGNDEAKTNLIARQSCLNFDDMHKYLGMNNGYAWHIDNLEILDKPMAIGEFYRAEDSKAPKEFRYWTGAGCLFWELENGNLDEEIKNDYRKALEKLHITRAPQSWQYAYLNGERVIIISIRPEWAVRILNGEKTIEVRKSAPKEKENENV